MFLPACPRRLWRGRGLWAPHHRRTVSEVSTHQLFSVSSLSCLCGAFAIMASARHTAWLTHHHVSSLFPRSPPRQSLTASTLAPPCTGVSRPVDGKPTWWLSTFAARRTQAPTLAANHFIVPARGGRANAFRYSRLSGTGDSDCAEWARRTARLSLRLRAPGCSKLDVENPSECWSLTRSLTLANYAGILALILNASGKCCGVECPRQ
ncbi:hypothetical protein LXA43DRAFT_716104 [Ganoderma leucocontextum]|nr:hypothetical protein LXA43DRAFT_716104 [Ganoderma leucocontextum]